jgi:hypothetical protein
LSASVVPSQAGKNNLICVHAKTQGIALKLFILSIFFLLEGLEPIESLPKAL